MTPEPIYDVVVVGGGLLGAATARDAALRGLSTALFAPEDFGASEGQNCRLAVGSLGALETLDFTRVREDCREREVLLQTAPDFVHPQPCLIPFYSPGLLAQTRLRASLALGDALGFDPLQHFDPALFQFDPPLHLHQILSAASARRHVPGLHPQGLTGAALVWEARVDCPARLARATAQDAPRYGATLYAHTTVEKILQEPGLPGRMRVMGIGWKDQLTGETGRTKAALVIITDPTGRNELGLSELGLHQHLTKSISVLVPSLTGTSDALALPSDNGALCYLVPSAAGCVLGPFEVELSGDCGSAYATGTEVTDLIESVCPFLPGLTVDAVRAAEVRVRVSAVPGREVHDPSVEGGRLDGLLSVSGGTLTTARRLAEDVLDLACRKLGRSLSVPPCRTAVTPVPALLDTSTFPLPAAVEHAVAEEDCRTLRDFLTRRTVFSPVDDPAMLAAIIETMTPLLGWDADRQARELKAWHAAQALAQTFRVL